MTQKLKSELDICISANSNLVHVEEKVSGRNIATMTMKGATREEKIAMAMKFAAAEEMLNALEGLVGDVNATVAFPIEKLRTARQAIAKALGNS